MTAIRVGIDIGSTTIKCVALDTAGNTVFSAYERHNARAREALAAILGRLRGEVGDTEVRLCLTGSVGMGVAERCGVAFVQEVVAATKTVASRYREARTMIDIGGEDAKVVFFNDGTATDLRMNGNCAGGTGAFIDQMAILLNVETAELNRLAECATTVHPIASRCGVFSKTDVQNLVAKNVSREDIAASVFHAVAVQVVVTLAHGADIVAPVLMCGGPLTFLPALRRSFAEYLNMGEADFIVPAGSHLIPAMGAAIQSEQEPAGKLSQIIADIESKLSTVSVTTKGLQPIFADEADHKAWLNRISDGSATASMPVSGTTTEATLGIDSGSTTTKIVVMDKEGHIIYRYYHNNDGNPIATALNGLREFDRQCKAVGADVKIVGSCSTGYGEELLKAAFGLDHGVIETIAHYMAARRLDKDVSFILDIGGQDMKAIFVSHGVVNRMELNEACSSGCGSFIETFAKSLGHSVSSFAQMACEARRPYDLGTRCTVFMNSKVKQALREGASINDIAAGLSYSVVKNCLYKVLRLKGVEELGSNIVVQGGTMRNDSVVRAFELLTGRTVRRSDCPELMGAVGCALYAREQGGRSVTVADLLGCAEYKTRSVVCKGCTNHCLVTAYTFHGGRCYYSGNRCETVFNNNGGKTARGRNLYAEKLRLLFNREKAIAHPVATVGIPRCLNQYEDYPFWHTLFTECDVRVVLSEPSDYTHYERCANHVMSDNICFPAKLVHSHVDNLVARGVDRIFMPYVVYERNDGGQNSFNCPIVTGYADVVKGGGHGDVPVDVPAITFKDKRLLYKQCRDYLVGIGVDNRQIKDAFAKAVSAMYQYTERMAQLNRETLAESRSHGRLAILLAGRPYHADPLVQHKLSDIIAAMGADVLTEDIVREADVPTADTNFIAQWAYPNRILKAAEWAASQDDNVQFMQMTSFGCGPDAFLTDETRQLLKRHGKALTLLKIDDISNIGSIKLRVRSCIDSLLLAVRNNVSPRHAAVVPFRSNATFTRKERGRTILIPFFTPFVSPLLPSLVHLAGYSAENLPPSDAVSGEWGLKYANNEVCYPATLITGDMVKAYKSGRYSPDDTAVVITQTGGQCRATNYLALIKRAMKEAGLADVPVLSLATGTGMSNEQPGFKINWVKIMPMVVVALIYSDCMAKMYYAALPRERQKGLAAQTLAEYLERAKPLIESNAKRRLWTLLAEAATAFDCVVGLNADCQVPRIGIVGEIFLKFNPFAQKNITEWLTEQELEVVPPMLTDFFMQSFVNTKVNVDGRLCDRTAPDCLLRWAYGLLWKKIERANDICARHFRCFTPFESIFHKADDARGVVSLYAQFGEGWLLPGEVVSMWRQGVSHVVSLQPFGCIANHIVAKGIEKRIKRLCPGLNFITLDFDSGVSDVNVRNRMLLFIDNLKRQDNGEQRHRA